MEALLSFGNVPFWGVVVLLSVITALLVFLGEWKSVLLPSFTFEQLPHVQMAVRWSVVLVLILCPFVECDYFFHEVTNPIGKVICVYLAAVLAFYLLAVFWFVITMLIAVLLRIVYWASGMKWPFK